MMASLDKWKPEKSDLTARLMKASDPKDLKMLQGDKVDFILKNLEGMRPTRSFWMKRKP
jgi:hypothetical protein